MRRNALRFTTALGVSAVVVLFVVNARAQRVVADLPAEVASFTTARSVTITDEKGQVLLEGAFSTTSEDADEVERTAPLSAAQSAATGVAEIELERDGSRVTKEELEVSAKGPPPGASCKVAVDGTVARTFTTSRRGEADLKLTRATR